MAAQNICGRLPLFFEKGTFEISVVWDEDRKCSIEDKIKVLGCNFSL